MREHGGLHAGAAHLGQCDGAGALRQAPLEAGLARGRLALARHQAVAEQHLVHLLRLDARALDGGPDGGTAQVMGRQVGEVALEGTHGCARGADDDDGVLMLAHRESPWG